MLKSENVGPYNSDVEGHSNPEMQDQNITKNAATNSAQFVGRIGANGTTIVLRCSTNEDFLNEVLDAASLMSLRDQFDLWSFLTVGFWKSVLMESVSMLCMISLCYVSSVLTFHGNIYDFVRVLIYANNSLIIFSEKPTSH